MQAPTAEFVHALHERFLTLVPEVERRAAAAVRRVRCPHRRADSAQEIVAASWALFLAAIERGGCPAVTAPELADLAVAHARKSQRLAGGESARDVMSARAQRKHGFTITAIPAGTVAVAPC
ncbi:MAG: hypothetical protein C0501_14300 [Isosphaera sp.]|nr:hypothetical protein [Isosphaera sp.]